MGWDGMGWDGMGNVLRQDAAKATPTTPQSVHVFSTPGPESVRRRGPNRAGCGTPCALEAKMGE